jgi:hypothetical protein
VRRARRDDEQVAGLDFVLLTREFAPTAPVRAVDENGLIDSLFALEQVSASLRKVPHVRRQQRAQQGMFKSFGHHPPRQHHNALAREAFAFSGSVHAKRRFCRVRSVTNHAHSALRAVNQRIVHVYRRFVHCEKRPGMDKILTSITYGRLAKNTPFSPQHGYIGETFN